MGDFSRICFPKFQVFKIILQLLARFPFFDADHIICITNTSNTDLSTLMAIDNAASKALIRVVHGLNSFVIDEVIKFSDGALEKIDLSCSDGSFGS